MSDPLAYFITFTCYGHWLHGEAVAAGMVCASRLAERRGLVPAAITRRQQDLLARFSLPIAPEAWSPGDLLAAMRSDKKAKAGRLRFVLPTRLGEVILVEDVPEKDVLAALAACG